MMQKWKELASLGLLDDSTPLDPPARAWQELFTESRRPPKVVPTLPPEQASAAATSAKRRTQNKVFSSKPTLRQMMQEYNRPAARNAPLKVSAGSHYAEFCFEQVDYISIPCIPGKVLRPARKS